LGNNSIPRFPEIRNLVLLEELSMTGNPLPNLPAEIGFCSSLIQLDFSFCQLKSIPVEFAKLVNLIDLNLSENYLQELPWNIGRLTRLSKLDVSGNNLRDLPVSLGYCYGLGKLGAGLNIFNNPIENQEMLNKYKIGVDHLFDYLEKRMTVDPNAPKWEDLAASDPPKRGQKEQPKALAPQKTPEEDASEEEKKERQQKVTALIGWGIDQIDNVKSQTLAMKGKILACTTIQELADISLKLQCLQTEVNSLKDDPEEVADSSSTDLAARKKEEENRIYELNRSLTFLSRELSSKAQGQVQMSVIYKYIKSIKQLAEIIK